MEQSYDISGFKKGHCLYFERGDKKIAYDLKDHTFKRILKGGTLKELKGSANFFRNLSARKIADGFKEDAYGKLIELVNESFYGRSNANFARIFERAAKYQHLEGYLLLGIPVDSYSAFTLPVSQFPKQVIEFMKESRITFDDVKFEKNFIKYPEIVTNLLTHVRKNHYLDLEVYRNAYKLITDYNFERFIRLVSPQVSVPEWDESWRGNKTIKDTGYGCEYKTLFSYMVMINRTEAVSFTSVLTLLADYLKMAREIERWKAISKMRETNPTLNQEEVGFLNFHKIERYPKYLKTRHDIVQKNYRDWEDDVNEEDFKSCVEKGYAFEKGKYMMVVPRNSRDVRNEGTNLHHCVASYVSRILDGTTQILFMRKEAEESLVTVEVRAGAIVQARGYNNRSIDEVEEEWLKTFAKAKNLSYKNVKRDEKMPTPPIVALQKWDSHNAMLLELGAI